MSRPPAGGTLRLASVPAVLVIAVVAAIVLAGGRARASEPLQTRPSSPLHAGWQVGPEHPVSDPVYVSAAPSQSLPKIAFDGANYLVVWREDRGNQYGDVYASRVAPDGTALDPHGIPIATARASELNPAVAFDGTNYLVTWTASSFPDGDLYGARVSPSGEVLDPGGFPISTAPGLQDFSALAAIRSGWPSAGSEAQAPAAASFWATCAAPSPLAIRILLSVNGSLGRPIPGFSVVAPRKPAARTAAITDAS